MNETSWQTGADGEEMLEFVADRLSPRQWLLASAAYARRLWDALPDGPLRQAIDAAELALEPLSAKERNTWLKKIDAAVPDAVSRAQAIQHAIVKPADPDAATVADPVLSKPNQAAPSFPLFQAASRHAANAIEGIGEAVTEAAAAVRVLFEEPGAEMLESIRPLVEQAAATRTRANTSANNALRLKGEGDEHADRSAGVKNKGRAEAEALEIVRKLEEGKGKSQDDELESEMKRERAAAKQLARVLREIVGNAFKPPRFEPAWRTDEVAALAQTIYEERAFERMVALADALLDADCDEEAILRHCRGTEVGVKEPPQHLRGCWVLELILGRYAPLPAPKPGKKPKPKRDPFDDFFDLKSLRGKDPFA
ncbi:hypothetical protein GobsT_03160 [Gemmata obscuriglobus]|uniref:hypothetical protein n=1 Tax=Gemmata obscuriglobus TaxID=114 RepID=UPI00016C500E